MLLLKMKFFENKKLISNDKSLVGLYRAKYFDRAICSDILKIITYGLISMLNNYDVSSQSPMRLVQEILGDKKA